MILGLVGWLIDKLFSPWIYIWGTVLVWWLLYNLWRWL